MTRSLCAHCQRSALSTPAQQWERRRHVRNTVRPRPPLHRSGRDLLRSRLVASQDSRTRPVGRTPRRSRSTGRASPTDSSAVGDSFRLGHCRTCFVISGVQRGRQGQEPVVLGCCWTSCGLKTRERSLVARSSRLLPVCHPRSVMMFRVMACAVRLLLRDTRFVRPQ